MKKNFLKSLLALLFVPIIILTGCKTKSLPAINISRYFKDTLTITQYKMAETSTDSINMLLDKKANPDKLSKYLKLEFDANTVWIYKMYIESVSFYVYTNSASDFEMIVNLKITNLADEETILNTTTETIATETVEEQVSFAPQKNKSFKCEIKINKTIVNAFGSTFSIDVMNSPELFSNGNEENDFKWLIYGLEIHGESRTYTK